MQEPIRVVPEYYAVRAIISPMVRGESRTLLIDHYKYIVTFDKEGLFEAACYDTTDENYPYRMAQTPSLRTTVSWIVNP